MSRRKYPARHFDQWGNKLMLRKLVCRRSFSGFFEHFIAKHHQDKQKKSEDQHAD